MKSVDLRNVRSLQTVPHMPECDQHWGWLCCLRTPASSVVEFIVCLHERTLKAWG